MRPKVRNTANGIVQFEYGDDGRDPVAMEGSSGQALDLERMLSHTCATACPATPSDDAVRCSCIQFSPLLLCIARQLEPVP